MELNRRSVIRGIGAASATLVFAGLASADDGRARYIVRTNGNGADVESAGFDVLNELAGGDVLLVAGPDDAAETLETADGVAAALRDLELELEPVLEDEHDEIPDDPDDVYDTLLWDKQVQEVREAQEHATGDGTTVAIIDTGVAEHPDLSTLDTDASATIIDGEIVDHQGDPNGHGTHVAGTAAATGDVLMTGTAPDATIVSVDVLGYGTGSFGDIMLGMEHAADVGADAANISLGFMMAPQDFADFDDNVGLYRQMFEPVANYGRREGTLYVGSAGNDDTDLQGGWLRLWNGLSGVIGVSATGPNDKLSFYSNWGRNDVDVGAPGGGYETEEKTVDPGTEWPHPLNLVFSTYISDEDDENNENGNGNGNNRNNNDAEDDPAYAWLAGTSMAAPQVTGIAALVRELDPDANTQQVLDAIRKGAEVADNRGDPELGAGRVNALNTVERF
ncbi:peptidase S8/S53 subtilisin kexin sedolisin [Natronococcus amylolyticus DSM 10524]|uniref:Peptidase S8/S53 subtilisin kexin sedolisin n=1 Tax=Natronococcus amylolyticus DSM 10524 TaxID=1227497 RepID=L9WZP4_9EURY|nr:S8 family serine peptidase [Natronococcus amylolyticus]ELY54959.1 peptidase S8/S53 subtilisin kexin sedolisin [Natronococcus amylolyticus DSM 10524]